MEKKRRWCSGNISDFHSEAPVSITGRRITFFFIHTLYNAQKQKKKKRRRRGAGTYGRRDAWDNVARRIRVADAAAAAARRRTRRMVATDAAAAARRRTRRRSRRGGHGLKRERAASVPKADRRRDRRWPRRIGVRSPGGRRGWVRMPLSRRRRLPLAQWDIHRLAAQAVARAARPRSRRIRLRRARSAPSRRRRTRRRH